MKRKPAEEIEQQLDNLERGMAGAYGPESGTVRSLILTTRAVLRLNATSGRLARVNIWLAAVMALAAVLQLLFLILKR